jgi:Flp pilus assembly pilin Flp
LLCFLRSTSGVSAIEYGVVAGLLCLTAVVGLKSLGDSISDTMGKIRDNVGVVSSNNDTTRDDTVRDDTGSYVEGLAVDDTERSYSGFTSTAGKTSGGHSSEGRLIARADIAQVPPGNLWTAGGRAGESLAGDDGILSGYIAHDDMDGRAPDNMTTAGSAARSSSRTTGGMLSWLWALGLTGAVVVSFVYVVRMRQQEN